MIDCFGFVFAAGVFSFAAPAGGLFEFELLGFLFILGLFLHLVVLELDECRIKMVLWCGKDFGFEVLIGCALGFSVRETAFLMRIVRMRVL